jgi:L-histidine N-alpha-methyltransferase
MSTVTAWRAQLQPAADPQRALFLRSVLDGLARPQKTLDCKYLYDARGSRLFDEICRLPEYYLTRAETAILEERAGAIAQAAGPHAELVELGSGTSMKTRILLSALDRPARYLPLDIATEYLHPAAETLRKLYPGLEVVPVEADFTAPLSLPPGEGPGKRVLFFPGSTIGNFDRPGARRLLERLRRELAPDLLVIGVDLMKPARVLHAAYDDASGVTAAFNLNLLARINRELGADFDLKKFRHLARVDEEHARVEMHLVSVADQVVHIAGTPVRFEAGETIHTESAHKYTVRAFQALARAAGWRRDSVWTDPQHQFSVHMLRPALSG